MKRFPPLALEYVLSRLRVDVEQGCAYWIDPTKYHAPLAGAEAGTVRDGRCLIKLDGIPYRRAHIVFLVKTGRWPTKFVDHKDGDALNDRGDNLREATVTENNWNHRTRAKASSLPMGIRKTASGRYQARIACNKVKRVLGVFDTVEEAHAVYLSARKESFGAFDPM